MASAAVCFLLVLATAASSTQPAAAAGAAVASASVTAAAGTATGADMAASAVAAVTRSDFVPRLAARRLPWTPVAARTRAFVKRSPLRTSSDEETSPRRELADTSFRNMFDMYGFCQSSWNCNQNPDGSVTLSAYHNAIGGFMSKRLYLYGKFSAFIKLSRANSAGHIHSLYLMQEGDIPNSDKAHAEIDIELMGAANPRNTIFVTNIIVGGYQQMQQHRLPFDPSAAFHKYSLVWSPRAITWFIDDVPIRLSIRDPRYPWPNKPLRLQGSIWQAPWAGLSDYADGPVSMRATRFSTAGSCSTASSVPPYPPCASPWASRNPRQPWNLRLNARQMARLRSYRVKYLVKAWDWGRWDGGGELLWSGRPPSTGPSNQCCACPK